MPLVGINAMVEGGLNASVRFDPFALVKLAGEYLRQRGRTRPAIIFLDSRPEENRPYARKIGEALREAAGLTEPVQAIGVRQPTAYSGRVAMRHLLDVLGVSGGAGACAG